jgi:hypothetical protein
MSGELFLVRVSVRICLVRILPVYYRQRSFIDRFFLGHLPLHFAQTSIVVLVIGHRSRMLPSVMGGPAGCFCLAMLLATPVFGEPALSLGSLPNIIPERHNAIVTDRL